MLKRLPVLEEVEYQNQVFPGQARLLLGLNYACGKKGLYEDIKCATQIYKERLNSKESCAVLS